MQNKKIRKNNYTVTKKKTVPVPAHRGKTMGIPLGGGKYILGLDLGPRGHKYTSKKKKTVTKKTKKNAK